MITALALKVANYFVKKGVAEEEDIEIYQYGVGLFLSSFFDISLALIISLFTGMFLETVCFLIYFISLRTLTGGYHANSYFKCFLVFIIIYFLCSLIVYFTPNVYIIQIIFWLTVFASVLILVFSPVSNTNKPLSKEQKVILRKKSITLYFIQITIVFLGIYFLKDFTKIFYFASLGYITASTSLAVAVIKDKERR